jgi:hypothetical protein
MAGERATEREANIRELGYRSVEFGTSAPTLPNTEIHWSGDSEAVSVNSPSCNST